MALSFLNNSVQRITFGDSITNWVDDGTSLAANSNYYLSNNSSIADSLARNQTRGFSYNVGAVGTLDLTDKIISIWMLCNIPGFLEPMSVGGICVMWTANGATFGNGNAGNFEYRVAGSDTYDGGWIKFIIDPTRQGFVGANLTTPTIAQLSAVSHIGMYWRVGNQTVPGNVDNTFIDSIDIHNRKGIQIVGTSSDLFEDLYQKDTVEGTGSPAGPIGLFNKENNVYLFGSKLLLGSGTVQTDVTGVGSTVVFLDPPVTGTSPNTTDALTPLAPALSTDCLGYHISGNNTKVQFGQSNLVGGVTTITAGRKYEFIMEPTTTGNFYSSRFDEIGMFGQTGTNTTLRGVTYSGGGWDVTGDIVVPNSNYLFNNCQFNNCAQIVVNDSVWVGGFVTDFEAPVTGIGSTGCDDLGAMKITPSFDVTDTNFIGNVYAINLQETGSYIYSIVMAGNIDETGASVDVINCTTGTGILLIQEGFASPATGDGSNPNGGVIDIQSVKTLTITGFVNNSELYMRDYTPEAGSSTVVTRFNEESAIGSYEYVYGDPGSAVDLFVMKNKTTPTDTGYQWLSIRNFALPNSNQSLQIFQIRDRNT